MSLNNVLPWWVYAVQYEQHLAMCSCAFTEEWYSGTSKELPKRVVDLIKRNEREDNPCST